MKILICGNLGYIGTSTLLKLRKAYPEAELTGFDIGYYAHVFCKSGELPDKALCKQIYGDIRNISPDLLKGTDVIVNLAAISNDAMGKRHEKITLDINYHAAVRLARMARENGVKSYIFASSCSMYGEAENLERNEEDELFPVTNYSNSKMLAEQELKTLATDNFGVTALRFATASGWNNRIRMDIVLNDFVYQAITKRKILILSDGSSWRPLIDVSDIAQAICWSVVSHTGNRPHFLPVNIGSNKANFQILQLAQAVAEAIPGTEINVNPDARPDKRSYKVNFDLFEKLAPGYQPVVSINSTITKLEKELVNNRNIDTCYREIGYSRYDILEKHLLAGYFSQNLDWRF